MIAQELRLAGEVSQLYVDRSADPGFAEVLDHFGFESDNDLAELIEADGRLRLRLKRPVTLNRYLEAVPDLSGRRDPLDAAIDMSLRSLARTGRADEASVQRLIESFPQLGPAIREAAALNNALWSTRRVRRHLVGTSIRELPCDFGPILEGGGHRYELRELLGEGAFGQVYLAVDRQLSEEDHPAYVAIKLLCGDDRSGQTRQHLIDEATKARRINHPNVVRVLDRGVSDHDEDFLVYEFVAGGDLARWARRHRDTVPVEPAIRMVARIARGVHAAHMAGLVHCDLKPNNIVLTKEGEPKVADFGVAIRAGEHRRSEEPAADDPAPVGNLAFMSPEQYRREEGALTIPTDVYGLGGILYWLLTGILPNGATPESIQRTHDPVRGRAAPPALRPYRPKVDRDLEAVCQRALAARPDDRFSSAAALAANLEAWLDRKPITWTRPSAARRISLWARRKPAIAAAAAAILILLVSSGAALQHLASVARQERFEAAVAAVELEKEEKYRLEFRKNLGKIIKRFKVVAEEGLAHEVLPQIWLAEWLFGPTILGDGPERFELWRLRLEMVRDLLHRASAEGRGNHILALQWQSALGFWLINEWYYTEAEEVLADSYAGWEAVADPRDPWLTQLRALQACAAVGRVTDCNLDDLKASASPEQIAALAETLDEAERMLSADDWGTPLHHVVLVHLDIVHGPDLLDRPGRRAEVRETLQAVTE